MRNIITALCLMATVANAEPGKLVVRGDQPGVKISPIFYGMMTEEINYSYDGGLYAELIRNRIFKEDGRTPAHWALVRSPDGVVSMSLDATDPVNTTALSTSLRIDITSVGGAKRAGVANSGYWGIPVKPSTTYRASFYAKAKQGFTGPLTVSIESNNGATPHATGTVPGVGTTWKKYEVALTTSAQAKPSKDNRFVISAASPGTIWLNLVSLFPPTYNNRPNGNRIDLMEKLAGLRPTFLRFPGGNYLEGNTFDDRFDWRKTIGELEQRPGHEAPWGYDSSDGMGLLEFLYWCEDLKMEPLLGVFAGYALRGEYTAPGPALEPFVQEALDQIEYVMGDQATKWGRERARHGHPEPFKLRYVEVGNEDFFDRSRSYDGRFAQFYDAIKAKHPQLQIISTMPVQSRKPDVIDDHYYRSSAAMQQDAGHYDEYDRSAPKIFVGEWATTEGSPTPTMNAALGDAAWLIGLERNSDAVIMQAYAPLLVNVNPGGRQWATNLIGYDALNSYASPAYYVQKMYAENRGDTVLPVQVTPQVIETVAQQVPRGGIGLGTWRTQAEFKDVTVTRGNSTLFQSNFGREGDRGEWKFLSGDWRVADGVLRQVGDAENCRAIVGDPEWSDYTLSLKARKLSGDEGFLVLFHAHDSEQYLWWNIGGWGNSVTAIERSGQGAKSKIGPDAAVTIETNRWYDIRIELRGRDVKCFLDNKLVTEATDDMTWFRGGLYAAASREDTSKDVILKVVNSFASPQQIQIDLQGLGSVSSSATLDVLSGDPAAVNSIETPEKIVPKRQTITNASTRFVHEFPPHSVSVMRLKTP